MAQDINLTLQQNLPTVGNTNNTQTLDLGVDTAGFSDQWRQGRLRAVIPALPNATNNAVNITLTLQDSIDGGNTFQNTQPLIQVVLAGVATNGTPAYGPGQVNAAIDMPLPPGLRGPIQVQQSVPATIGGDCSGAVITYEWVDE
ncbi:MAG: hypothetical protein ABSE16_14630 [Verrucomicrobiota bacterium]|jgi:hypothetical protein